MNSKVYISFVILIISLIEAQAQIQACTHTRAKLQKLMISGDMFTGSGSLSLREAEGTHDHQLLVSWKLIHPLCMERVCIEFLDHSLNDYCMNSSLSNLAEIDSLPCNVNIRIRVKAVAVGFTARLYLGSIYIGGNPRSRPKAAPSGVFTRQMLEDPLRIEMGWEPLRCMQQNSGITGYYVEFGRTNTTELRSFFTTERHAYSGVNNSGNGFGSLSYGQEYWFRVAARNTNGQGPFTPIVKATPSATHSDAPSTTSLPSTTNPDTLLSPTTQQSATSQSAGPNNIDTTKPSILTTSPLLSTTQMPHKITKKTTKAPLTTVLLTTIQDLATTEVLLPTTSVTTTAMEAPLSTTQDPFSKTKQETISPLITTKEPHATTDEPTTTTNIPLSTTKEPLSKTKQQTIGPIITTKEPHTTTDEPTATTNIPLSTTKEPLSKTKQQTIGPIITTKEPHTTTDETITTTNISLLTTKEPLSETKEQTTTIGYQFTTKESQISTEESTTTTNTPLPTTQEPLMTTKDPIDISFTTFHKTTTTEAHLATIQEWHTTKGPVLTTQEPVTTAEKPNQPVSTSDTHRTTTEQLSTTKVPQSAAENSVSTTKAKPKLTTITANKREHTEQSTNPPPKDITTMSTVAEKSNAPARNDGSLAISTTSTTTLNKNNEVQSTTTKSEKERLSIEALRSHSEESSTVIAVSVLLAIITLVTGVLIALILIWMLWRHRAVWKTQKRVDSLNMLNTNFLEINRESQLFEMPNQNIYEEIKLIEPRLTEYTKNVSVQEGEEVNLRVSFTGIPRPSITWFFNGKRMPLESRNGWEHCSDGCIFIAAAEGKHTGIYDFILSNSAGSVEGCTTLSVTEKEIKRNEDRMSCLFVDSNPIEKKKFGEHVSAYHGLNNSGFIEEYEFLLEVEEEKITTVGRKSGNRMRNLFRNVMCYDDNRIVLDTIPGYLNCHHDYINASYINGHLQSNKYIAAQAPMRATITDFWRLIWQEKVQNIAMLTNLMEGRQRKCELYWPESGSKVYGPFTVTLVEEQVFADYTIRTMHLVAAKPGDRPNLQKVTQFHFTSWPDHGVPKYAGPLLQFLRRIKALHKPKSGPLLVHCSGGVGRTGTLIGIDIALAQAARQSVVDIPAIVTKMRNERMKMVQSPDQYAFIHDAVLEWLICGDTKISAVEMRAAMGRLAQIDIQTEESGYDTQFKVLQQVSPYQKHIERETALKCPEKNRNSNYLPPDRWRVILKAQTIETTYIHASFVNAYKQRRGLIIAQAPMKNTAEDFWKMVYERECSVIVMLSNLTEKGKEVCYQYWPIVKADTRIDGVKHGTYTVFTLESRRENGYMIRTFGVTDNKSDHMRRVTQFHMTKWNEEGLCENPAAIMEILDEMFLIQRRTGNKPIVIHGCDTISRCGVFCALVNCIECCKTESVVDVFQAVKALRIQKPGIIQTVEQYKFIHDLMLLFLNTFSQYSNFK